MQEDQLILVTEICTQYNVELSFMHQLEEHGLIESTNLEDAAYIPVSQLQELEKIIHLHYDLEINIEGIDVIRHLLRKLELAQTEIENLKNKVRFYEVF